MQLHDLAPNNRKKRKRVGRGTGSGHGRTSGRGDNGQGQRKSGNVRPGFEGGQTPLWKRLPKLRGFTSRRPANQVVNLIDLETHFNEGDVVNIESLKEKGLISSTSRPVKILGNGKLTKKLTIEIEQMSETAKKSL